MDFEVWSNDKEPDVSYKPALINFPAFEFYKEQAERVADQIRETEVTEENVKKAKEIVANARKITDELSRRRIDIKKEILAGFVDFENKVNEISRIINEADGEVRSQIREIEERERDEKRERIKELWDKRVIQYQIFDLLDDVFDKWIQPKHLNKTTSMKSIESEMVEWLEETEKAIDALKAMDDEYLVEYLSILDFTVAVQNVNSRKDFAEMISENTDHDFATFIVYGKANIKLVEMMLMENEINYRRK